MPLTLQNPQLSQYKDGVPANIPQKYAILWLWATVVIIAIHLHHVMRPQENLHKVYTNI